VGQVEANGFAATPAVPAAPAAPRKPRKRWTLLVIGLVLSVVLPVLAFRGVDLGQSWRLMRQCDGPLLALGGAFFLLTLMLRSWRWQIMLSAHQPVKLRSALSATCVGYMSNNVLPFRLSEVVRAGVLRRLEKVSAARGLGSLAVERVIDSLTLVLLLGAYLTFAAGTHRAELLTAGGLALGGGLLLVMGLILGYRWRGSFARMVEAVFSRLSPKLGSRLAKMAGRFFEGFQVFTSPIQVGEMFVVSVALWAAAICSHYFVGRSLGLDLPWVDYTVVVFTTAFGIIIPAAPGAVGTFHSFACMGLWLVGMQNKELGLAFAVILHATEWTLMNVTGLYFLIADHLSLAAEAARGASDATPTITGGGSQTADYTQPA
jgi:uncharacterized protein (TIRG00374 family)